jgi:hypothetical protein
MTFLKHHQNYDFSRTSQSSVTFLQRSSLRTITDAQLSTFGKTSQTDYSDDLVTFLKRHETEGFLVVTSVIPLHQMARRLGPTELLDQGLSWSGRQSRKTSLGLFSW